MLGYWWQDVMNWIFDALSYKQRCSMLVLVLGLVSGQALWAQKPSPLWKNQIEVPGDTFRVLGSSAGDPDWIKFTILLDEPNTVYFQDSRAYAFHYDFATRELDAFRGMTVPEFSRQTLYAAGQRAILGAVIMPPSHAFPPRDAREYGIQFVRLDPYTREEIEEMIVRVREAIRTEPGYTTLYFPSFEQQAVAQENREWFAAQGIEVSSAARWTRGDICYAPGWALGRLTYVSASDIDSAYLEGRLLPQDILLTDGVPAQIPLVAGILTLTPSTPNSHVAILSRNYGIPFAHLNQEAQVQRTRALDGHDVVLRAYVIREQSDLSLIDVEGVLGPEMRDEILDLKAAPQLDIQAMTPFGALSASTDGLVISDTQFFGGKAANFGLLRRTIPDYAPRALAFSFDLWNAFLDQPYGGGDFSLRDEIDRRLTPLRVYPPADVLALSTALREIRESLFKNDRATQLGDDLKTEILGALTDPAYDFAAGARLRFRSSTNVEDSAQFSGAGLYDSFSGCMLDDLDDDDQGPSHCDPNRARERGVLRAIRRVFASFYNEHAFLERLRHGVNESDVGMGLLVHPSFPDEIELANGVATMETAYGSNWSLRLVTQAGALSVTNPTNGSIPEEVQVYVSGEKVYPRFVQGSNAVLLGAKVLTWEDDYIHLSQLIARAGEQYKQETGKTDFMLDLEYKKTAPEGKLVIKQVREIPQPDTTPGIVPFLVQDTAGPNLYQVYQGEYGDVFANHRLKSFWQFHTQNQWLNPKQLNEGIYAHVHLDYVLGDEIHSITGDPRQWAEYDFSFADTTTTETWVLGQGLERRDYRLETFAVGELVAPSESAILTLNDLGRGHRSGSGFLELSVRYAKPVPRWDLGDDALSLTDTESVLLWPAIKNQEGEKLQERCFTDQGITVTTSFYWPPPPTGPTAGYTAPLTRWHRTVIEGITSEPIVLQGEYSQTYRPGHHNFFEQFLFEPGLEPGLDPQIRDELRARDVRQIYFAKHPDLPSSGIITLSFDD